MTFGGWRVRKARFDVNRHRGEIDCRRIEHGEWLGADCEVRRRREGNCGRLDAVIAPACDQTATRLTVRPGYGHGFG